MRTTINLPDELLAQIKKLAATSRSTITALMDALREALARRRRTRRHERVTLSTYGKQGLLPGVDLDDTASVLDLMESSIDPARR